ncbi:hypothetical protein ABZ470_37075 [Streptosporangium sp. NPDC020072]|uniref:hypothetical protein n=1 Tax=Streptosporangium sp. NPDC020072 TaxID=3154788 RepID=UPI0034226BA0
MPLQATRTITVLVVITLCVYVVGQLIGHGDVIIVTTATAIVGVVTERLTQLILRRWVRAV